MGDRYMTVLECARWMSGITCEEMKSILLEAGYTIIRYNGEDWVTIADFNSWISSQFTHTR